MPFYEYICKNCGHTLEELQTMSEPELVTCPVCKHDTLKKMIGSGSGLIFKGSGFYLTDYKKKSSSESTSKDSSSMGKETSSTKKDTSSSGKDSSSAKKDSSSKNSDSKTDKKKNK